MKMHKALFVKIKVRLREENIIFPTLYLIIVSPSVMVFEIESWSKY
jgi:hypothetical protein